MPPDAKQPMGRRPRKRRPSWEGLKRGLKAGASVALALVAGTFLACKSKLSSMTDAANPPPTVDGARAASTPPDAASPDAQPADGAAAKRGPKVDREQHRKGMPVPDNLLE